ncbi:histidine phosphatase family protein [Evansella sp. AB-rgal1]|uniref:histidine phosphatase family protein n=1 Tax=Evansella sp. AB-rgal1 TaxID=3242696 RepID=UPI00359D6583
MEILVVRHGESLGDIEQRHEGRADLPLTEKGIEQALLAAKWIQHNYPPTKIITSPLQRASKTAAIISSEATGVPVQTSEELMEWNNGLLAGMLRSESAIMYPLPEGGRKAHDTFYECESAIAFRSRAEHFWSKLLDSNLNNNNERVCLVSHGGMINMLYRCFLNLPIITEVNIRTGDTGIHLWEVDGKERIVTFSNYLGHLDNK